MTIYATVKSDLLAARKHAIRGGSKGNILPLSTLVGELDLKAELVEGVKSVSDETAISVIKKSVKGLEEMLIIKPDDNALKYEKSLLEVYLPKQLTEEEIRKEISLTIITNDGNLNMADIMNHLKEHFFGRYDGKLASTIAKELTS